MKYKHKIIFGNVMLWIAIITCTLSFISCLACGNITGALFSAAFIAFNLLNFTDFWRK